MDWSISMELVDNFMRVVGSLRTNVTEEFKNL